MIVAFFERNDFAPAGIGDFTNKFTEAFFNVFVDSEDDEEELEGFRFEMPEVKWTVRGSVQPQSADPEAMQDRPKPAQAINLPLDAKPVDFFQLFFSDELLLKIVDWTIQNVEKKLNRPDREEKWTVTLEEIKAYLGVILITNSLLMTPRNESYFLAEESKWIFHTNINKIFLRDSFREIQRFIHFCNPNMPPDNTDRLHMVRPVIGHLQKKFMATYVLGRDVSVDESMIPFKGYLAWTQRMPQKLVKVGIKVLWLQIRR